MAQKQHTTRPTVTGSSVLGIRYDGGVLLAADTLLSYGSLAKHQGVSRLVKIPNTNVLLAASGEFADFQELLTILKQKSLDESHTVLDDLYADNTLDATSVWNYLRYLTYQQRNKFNPYWNELLVAGSDFLGSVDKIGTTIQDQVLATGFGRYLALPMLREKWRPDLTEGEARAILEDCLKILFYRDCRASSLIQLAKADAATGTTIVSDPYHLETDWSLPAFATPKNEGW